MLFLKRQKFKEHGKWEDAEALITQVRCITLLGCQLLPNRPLGTASCHSVLSYSTKATATPQVWHTLCTSTLSALKEQHDQQWVSGAPAMDATARSNQPRSLHCPPGTHTLVVKGTA